MIFPFWDKDLASVPDLVSNRKETFRDPAYTKRPERPMVGSRTSSRGKRFH
jgi:hypothetical protein